MSHSVSASMKRSPEYQAFASAYEREYKKVFGEDEVAKPLRRKKNASKRSPARRKPGWY